MKKVFTFLVAILLTATIFAQAPQKMSYQAVIRNSSAALVPNKQIGMEINIRQGSQTGTVVYTETQTPTTNANGLISIEIGGGTGFSSINWASANYYMETKTAVVAPLTTYTITGVSQLLSIPYALSAKTAESITGTITETDPLYSASQAANITATNITNLGNLSGLNTGDQDLSGLATTTSVTNGLATKVDKVTGKGLSTNDYTTAEQTKLSGIATGAEVNVQADWNQTTNTADDYIKNKPIIPAPADGSETKVTAGTNVTVTGIGTITNPYVINVPGGTTFTIGQSYQGGIIFWLDASGQHGLIASTSDQTAGTPWYNGTYRVTGTSGDGLHAGIMNTAMIVATQMADNQTGFFAARVCADYSVTAGGVTYGDWYLPSKYELNLLYLQKTLVGGFASAFYWSSTENDNFLAWLQTFVNSTQSSGGKNTLNSVRAIRAF